MSERTFDVVVWTLIAVFGLVTAYVTFGILSSQASTEVQGYSVEGALAGFVVSAGVLTSIYLQVRKSSNEVEALHRRILELQNKLLRGAPRPLAFETEVSERQRIVLARPEKWRPSGGIIFDYQLPLEALKEEDDRFPPQFRVTYQPIEEGKKQYKRRPKEPDEEQTRYYNNVKDNLEELIDDHEGVLDKYTSWQSYSTEYIYLGGETQPIKSLKFIAHEYVRVDIKPPDRMHTRFAVSCRPIKKAEYESEANRDKDDAAPQLSSFVTEIMYVFVVCYCEPLKTIYHSHFWEDLHDFVESSNQFNQVINSVRFLT
jgi:hypothetical protein